MKKYLFISLVLILSMLLSACNQAKTTGNNGSHSDAEESISIMTSLYPLQYFSERIGGDLVKVESLLPPGSDAHTFEPTSKDMISIAESDLFRSEERRVGKECNPRCRSRWSPYH